MGPLFAFNFMHRALSVRTEGGGADSVLAIFRARNMIVQSRDAAFIGLILFWIKNLRPK